MVIVESETEEIQIALYSGASSITRYKSNHGMETYDGTPAGDLIRAVLEDRDISATSDSTAEGGLTEGLSPPCSRAWD
jgi:hypothetical protein